MKLFFMIGLLFLNNLSSPPQKTVEVARQPAGQKNEVAFPFVPLLFIVGY